MSLKKQLAIIGAGAALLGVGLPSTELPIVVGESKRSTSGKNFKKPLSDYYTPPRSMTPGEQEFYSKHKHLNGYKA